jgi:hypothetical protein
MSASNGAKELILQTVKKQNGIVFAQPAYVYREVYRGRDIIAKNSEPKFSDARGYFKVERWIMSATEAENEKKVSNEGVTRLITEKGDSVLLKDAIECAGEILFGGYRQKWPLTKILDIGGPARVPTFTDQDDRIPPPEVPPIPCHVHSGLVCSGHLCGQGKTEAYFFPPLDLPPYNVHLDNVITRLGIKPDTSREEVIRNLKKFGITDDLYSDLNVFEIHPWETWHIESRVVHAPGPWLTFEIQRPQDDFNILAWQLGMQLEGDDLQRAKDSLQLRGLRDEHILLDEAVDWDLNTDRDFRSKWWHKCEVLEQESWGRRCQLFYHCFYGEGIIINPGFSYTRIADKDGRPFAAIVWSGTGTVNGLAVASGSDGRDEFIVAPGHSVTYDNTKGNGQLLILSVYPIQD